MGITEWVAGFATQIIQTIGYFGVFLLMTAESMVLPVPSEAVMPFAGFLVAEGAFHPALIVAFATLGSITGSMISYVIGCYGGKPFLSRFGKFLLLDAADLENTDRFFRKMGSPTIFIARFIPIVRHLISIPAGLGGMKLLPFSLFTIAGAGLWNAFLTWCGFILRKNWSTVMRYSRYVDIAVIVLIAALLGLFFSRHLRRLFRGKHGPAA